MCHHFKEGIKQKQGEINLLAQDHMLINWILAISAMIYIIKKFLFWTFLQWPMEVKFSVGKKV